MKYKLDLTKYEVEIQKTVVKDDGGMEIKTAKDVYPQRTLLSDMLRGEGIHSSGADFVDACDLARSIRNCEADSIEIDEKQADILKKTINYFVARKRENNPQLFILGGEMHEECIRRVIKMQEVKQ